MKSDASKLLLDLTELGKGHAVAQFEERLEYMELTSKIGLTAALVCSFRLGKSLRQLAKVKFPLVPPIQNGMEIRIVLIGLTKVRYKGSVSREVLNFHTPGPITRRSWKQHLTSKY